MFYAQPNVARIQLPEVTRWRWDFGDGTTPPSPKVGREESDLREGHQYNKNGEYDVKLEVVARSANKLLATITKKIIVSDISSIQKTNQAKVILTLSGGQEGPNEPYHYQMKTIGADFYQRTSSKFVWKEEWRNSTAPSWSGDEVKFAIESTYTIKSSSGQQEHCYYLNGRITTSLEGIFLVDCYYYETFRNPNYNGTGNDWYWDTEMYLQPIPLTKISGGDRPVFQAVIKTYKNIYPYIKSAQYVEMTPDGRKIEWMPSHDESNPECTLTVGFSYVAPRQ